MAHAGNPGFEEWEKEPQLKDLPDGHWREGNRDCKHVNLPLAMVLSDHGRCVARAECFCFFFSLFLFSVGFFSMMLGGVLFLQTWCMCLLVVESGRGRVVYIKRMIAQADLFFWVQRTNELPSSVVFLFLVCFPTDQKVQFCLPGKLKD